MAKNKQNEMTELEAAKLFDRLKNEYDAETEAAANEGRDRDVFEVSSHMISLCNQFGWEIPDYLK